MIATKSRTTNLASATGRIKSEVCGTNGERNFSIRVASDRASREKAFRLAHEVYVSSHLIDSHPSGMLISPYDAEDVLVLIAENREGEMLGTISLIFDSHKGLPCDAIYKNELMPLREQGRKLIEVSRFAIRENLENSNLVIAELSNLVLIFARRVRHFTDLVIEVNPRHAIWYRRMLYFQPFGGERPCHRVKGAPAVLLRLDLYAEAEETRRIGGSYARGEPIKERTLYPYFRAYKDESLVAENLAKQVRPMSVEEADYFDIKTKPCLPEHSFAEFSEILDLPEHSISRG